LCIAGEEIFPSPETDDRHDEDKAVVILKDGKMKYGFIVDTTAENEPFVLYPLDQRLGPIRGVLGTAMTAEGSATLIVDADALFAIVKNKTP
jgi:chemotaxis protein histidine kinase CheA